MKIQEIVASDSRDEPIEKFVPYFDLSVATHGEILSDTHQTPEAVNAWKKLIKFPGAKMTICLFDTESGVMLDTHKLVFDQIWNQDISPVLAACKKQRSKKLQEYSDIDNEIKKKYGRDHDSLWFGPQAGRDKDAW